MEELSEEFTKSESLEATLSKINHAISAVDVYQPRPPSMPLMFLFGCPRSGTTLFMQWIASLGCLGYPSNLIARFFGNPAFGCEVQKALVDYDKGDQLGLSGEKTEFSSNLGRSRGLLAPSEFWYYWRRFFEFGESNHLSESELAQVDSEAFLNGIGAMEASIGKPIAMKAMILDWNIPYLHSLSDRIVFVSLKREAFNVAQSILLGREQYAGDRNSWWSFKPPEYPDMMDLPPIEQVAAQTVYTQRAVDDGMASLPASHRIELDYLEFCEDPRGAYEQISKVYENLGHSLPEYSGAPSFSRRDDVRLNPDEESQLREALERFQSEA